MQNFDISNLGYWINSFKYLRSQRLNCKDIGIRKSELVQRLNSFVIQLNVGKELSLCHKLKFSNPFLRFFGTGNFPSKQLELQGQPLYFYHPRLNLFTSALSTSNSLITHCFLLKLDLIENPSSTIEFTSKLFFCFHYTHTSVKHT